MKIGIIAIFSLFFLGLSALAQETEKLPAAAQAALSKMEQDIERAQATAVVTLKRALTDETRKGNLKGAVA